MRAHDDYATNKHSNPASIAPTTHFDQDMTNILIEIKHLEQVRDELSLDMQGQMQENVPVPRGDHTEGTEFLYDTNTLERTSYIIHCHVPAPSTTSTSSTKSEALFQQLMSWDK